MKNTSKILALVLVVMTVFMSLSAITASAAGAKVVNVSDLTITKTTDDELVAGTGIYASAGLSIDSNSKSIDGFEFTKRLKLGGTMKVDGGVVKAAIKVVVDAPSKIVVYAMSSSSSTDRVLQIATFDGTSLTALGDEVAAPGSAIAKGEFVVDAEGTYYIGSKGSGINVYYIAVEALEVCAHVFEGGVCTLCGTPDPNACKHVNKTPATCKAPEVCADCGVELSAALGHTAGAAATCATAQTCTVCGEVLADALGHTLTFVNTLPTPEAAGKTIADCSVCNEHFDFGKVNVMTPGTYVLDPADLADIAQFSLFDGEVKVVGGVFACHLSYKYRTDANSKSFTALNWSSTHRMNFGGASAFCNNGTGEEAVRNGGLKNYIQIVTTGETTLTFAWGIGGDGREIAVYDMEGNLVAVTEENGLKNDLAVSTLTVPAGAYLIGSSVKDGGNYIHKMIVDVVAPHTHVWSDATCTEPAKCECGETQGEALGHDLVTHTETLPTCTETGLTAGEECTRCDHKTGMEEIPALGHDYNEGQCTRCGEKDPDWEPPVEDPKDPEPQPEPNFFQKIIAWFMELINKLLAIFKK